MNDFNLLDETETIEDIARAEEDARHDMEEETLDEIEEAFEKLVPLVDSILGTRTYRWYAAYVLINPARKERNYGITYADASSQAEAIGLIYQELVAEFGPLDGWMPPAITPADEPVLHIPGLGSVTTPTPCPDCGDRRGQCEDLDECPNLIHEDEIIPDDHEIDPEIEDAIERRMDEIEVLTGKMTPEDYTGKWGENGSELVMRSVVVDGRKVLVPEERIHEHDIHRMHDDGCNNHSE